MIGRSREIELLKLAYVSGEHILFVGPPGTGKSLLVEEFAKSGGFTYFRYLLTKFTSPDELFGPVSLQGLKAGTFERVLTGRAADVEVLFLDEIFKASSAILNTLLTLMQERVFFNPSPVKTPLKMVVGASNEVPDGEESDTLQALWDRFLIRHLVEPIPEDLWEDLLDMKAPQVQINRQELEQAGKAAQEVLLTKPVKDLLIELRARIRQELGVIISDRRFVKSVKIIKAQAAIEGRGETDLQDATILPHVWVQDLNDLARVKDFIMSTIDPDAAEVERLRDSAREIVEGFEESTRDVDGAEKVQAAAQALAQLKDLRARLEKINSPSAKEVLAVVEKEQKRLMEAML